MAWPADARIIMAGGTWRKGALRSHDFSTLLPLPTACDSGLDQGDPEMTRDSKCDDSSTQPASESEPKLGPKQPAATPEPKTWQGGDPESGEPE
jgi:hypothetical protein